MFPGNGYADVLALLQERYGNEIANGRKLQLMPYSYPVSFGTFTANLLKAQSLSFTANADFLWTSTELWSAANAIGSNWVLQVTNAATGEKYSQGFIECALFASAQSRVQQQPFPKLIPGKSAFNVQLQSAAVVDDDAFVVFTGVLVRLLG